MVLNRQSEQYRRVQIKKEHTQPYIINIGCGTKCEEDAIGIDVRDNGQEILWDVMEGVPLPNNSVREIRMYHFLEHIEYRHLDAFFRELRRVSIVGALLDIRVPQIPHPAAYATAHLSFWSENAFIGLVDSFIHSKKDNLHIFEIENISSHNNERLLACRIKVLM